MQMMKSGISITGFNVMSFSYPKEIQDMITKNASHGMVSDVNRYQQISLTEGMATGKMSGGGAASDMAGMVMGMNIAGKMMNQMNQQAPNQPVSVEKAEPSLPRTDGQKGPNFCPNCGNKTEGANFCSNCGQKLV
jgi:membrane protease subunit (stomatin/prohibitin family)